MYQHLGSYALSTPLMFADGIDDHFLYLFGGQRFFTIPPHEYEPPVLDFIWRCNIGTGYWTGIRVEGGESIPQSLWGLFHWKQGAIGLSSYDGSPIVFFHVDKWSGRGIPQETISFYRLSAERGAEGVEQLHYNVPDPRAMPANADFDISMNAYGSSYDNQWHCVDEGRFILLQTQDGFGVQRTPLSTQDQRMGDRCCLFDIFELRQSGEKESLLHHTPSVQNSSSSRSGSLMEENGGGAKRRKIEKARAETEWIWDQISKDSYMHSRADSSNTLQQVTDSKEQPLLREWMIKATVGDTRSILYNGKLYIVAPSDESFQGDYATSFDLSTRSFSNALLRVLPDAEGCSFPGTLLSFRGKPCAVFENALYILQYRGSDDGSIPLHTMELWRLRIESATTHHFHSSDSANVHSEDRGGVKEEEVLQWKRLLGDMPLLTRTDRCTMACTQDGALYLYDYAEGDREKNAGLSHNPHHHPGPLPRCSCCGGESFGAKPPFFGRIKRLWLIKPPTLKNLATRAAMLIAASSYPPTQPPTSLPSSSVSQQVVTSSTAAAATTSTSSHCYCCLDCQCQNFPHLFR